MQPKKRKPLHEEMLKFGLASVTCVFAGFIVHPVDTVKIRMQLKSNKLANGGKMYNSLPHGLWKIAN